MVEAHDKTSLFPTVSLTGEKQVRQVVREVFLALQEKGYNPVGQLVGYLLSGDPTFITSHRNARNLITQLDRDAVLEELVTFYLDNAARDH